MTSLGEDHIQLDTQQRLVFAIQFLRQTIALSAPKENASAALIPEPNHCNDDTQMSVVRLTLLFKDQS